MADSTHILAIDQGTTSTRAILFDGEAVPQAVAQREHAQKFPGEGWVEHDPEEIWDNTMTVCRQALAEGGARAGDVTAIGITNQRETTLLWERSSGRPLHDAIVWQDRRTADTCRRLTADGLAETVRARTGLVIDPYFSATKIAWLLDHLPDARSRARRGEIAFGTMDTFLLWRLTGGAVHATDATNACRTMLFDIHRQDWDGDLLAALDIPREILPAVRDSAADFGGTAPDLLGGGIPIGGMAGDQHAATIGQACFRPGMIKSTYGTGAFAVLNTGDTPVESHNGMLTTLAYRLDGKPTYAIEGSIFVAGAAVKWLRDRLKLIASAAETEDHARALDHTGGVYLVPAFAGLGAPHWDADARGAIVGLTLDSGVPEIARAALESVCYQTWDLTDAMADDLGRPLDSLRVDGGMVVNDWLMQFLADVLDLRVERPAVTETTALGAAYLAGLTAGIVRSLDHIEGLWRRDRAFDPNLDAAQRSRLLEGWRRALKRVRT